MATRATSPRFRLLLALGLAAVPVSASRAQDEPSPPRESVAVDPQAPGEARTPDRERARGEREERALREQLKREREAELKALAERIRERNAASDEEAAREEREAQARRERMERERRRIEQEVAQSLPEIALIELRIETTREVIKVLAKQVAEAEIQAVLRDDDPANPPDRGPLERAQELLRRYEVQLGELILRKAELEANARRAERRLDQFNARLERSAGQGASARSVARSVDRLLGRLNEEGAIDEDDRRRASDAVSVIEELLELFRGHDEEEGPDRD